MELFKTLNKIEDGVRRGKLEKAGTEKMGVPHVMGAGDRSEVLSDEARSDKESEETEECKSSCEKDANLLDALGFMDAAKQGGVQMPEEEEDELEKAKRPSPKQRLAAKRERRLKGPTREERRAASAKMKAKKHQAAQEAAEKPKGAPTKGKSGAGSGQAGRTGKRKRRSVGEFWWAKSGNRPGMDLWTKRDAGTIVRANAEEKKKYEAERKKRGLEEHAEIETGPEDEHKKRTAYVRKIKEAKGLNKHLTKESRAEVLKALKQAGFKITEKEEAFLDRFLDEACSFKLSTGMPSQWARKPDQVKRDFLDGMDPQNYRDLKEFNKAKKRIEAMDISQFEAVFRSIMLDEDEDDLRSEYGIEGSWKGVKPKKSFDEALGDIVKELY
jgi:hypothetical protein